MTPDAVCCLETAALLWDCPLPPALQRDLKIHLAKASGGARPVRKGIAGHRLALRQQDVSMLDGVPVTGPARTWLDLASVLDFEDLVAAGDYFVCSQSRSFGPPKMALCSLADLHEQVSSNPGVRGIRKARLALELCRVGADSVPETRLRLALGRIGLPEPVLSYVVQDPTGWELAWPDMAFPDFKVAVNYDGATIWSRASASRTSAGTNPSRPSAGSRLPSRQATFGPGATTDVPTACSMPWCGRGGGSKGEVSALTGRDSDET